MPYQLTPITAIEGIGSQRAQLFQSLNIHYVEDLARLSAIDVVVRCASIPELPESLIYQWCEMARLMQVTNIDGQFAEALQKAKVRRLLLLANKKAEDVIALFNQAKIDGLIPHVPVLDDVIDWQKRAIALAYTGKVFGVLESNGQPVVNATIRCGSEVAASNQLGHFYLPLVRAGKADLRIKADGFKTKTQRVEVSLDTVNELTVELVAGQDESVRLNEANGDFIVMGDHIDKVTFAELTWNSTDEGQGFIFHKRYSDNDIQLLGLDRRLIDNELIVDTVRADANLMPIDEPLGVLVKRSGNGLVKLSQTLAEYREAQMQSALSPS